MTSRLNQSEGESEAKLRLRAIAEWARHAEAGECTIPIAVTAITELAAAADRFLGPEAV